jgi:hypothetical protein
MSAVPTLIIFIKIKEKKNCAVNGHCHKQHFIKTDMVGLVWFGLVWFGLFLLLPLGA